MRRFDRFLEFLGVSSYELLLGSIGPVLDGQVSLNRSLVRPVNSEVREKPAKHQRPERVASKRTEFEA